MATQDLKYTNGGTLAYSFEVTTAMDTDGEVVVNFDTGYPVVAIVQIQDASGVNVDLADAVITYPAEGQVSIADGAVTFALTATDIVNIVAFRKR